MLTNFSRSIFFKKLSNFSVKSLNLLKNKIMLPENDLKKQSKPQRQGRLNGQ